MSYNRIDSAMLTQMFFQGTQLLGTEKEAVNALNVYPVPDGDTGTNMSLTMVSAIGELQKKNFGTCAEVSKSVAKGSLMGARGNSGVILSQIFRGFSKGCEAKETLSVTEFAHALKEASDMAYRAVLKPVEGTILTVIRETAEKALHIAEDDMLFPHFFKLLLEHANKALDHTPELLAVLKQAGVVDAGGKGLVLILEGFQAVASGEEIPQRSQAEVTQEPVAMAQPHTADIRFTYCTEFILRGTETTEGNLQKYLQNIGDSLVFVTDEDLIKVHVHTNNPGSALEQALKVGELVSVKIENMKEQHSAITDRPHTVPEPEAPKSPAKPFGFIAVAAGEGLETIFRDLGVDVIIEGGQTMNPSTKDIVNGIGQINAECVFVLPNNSNIILAANQAQGLTDRKVIVLPSKSIPQGIAAMVQFNPDHEAEENEMRMKGAMKTVDTLLVTYSVRSTQMGEQSIQKDDTLGILNGEIIASGSDRDAVIMEALAKAIGAESEILTLYYGESVSEEEAAALVETLSTRYSQLEIEMYFGGQPVYSHLFSIE